MKRNILVCNAHDMDGGAGLSCAVTIEVLVKAGYNVVLVSGSKGKMTDILSKHGIHIIYCHFPGWFPMPINGKRMNLVQRIKSIFRGLKMEFASVFKIEKKLKLMGFRPDLVYTNTIVFPIGVHLANIYHVPHIYHIREYGYEDFRMYFVLGKKFSSFLANRSTVKALCISKGVQKVWTDFFKGKTELVYNGIQNLNAHFVKRVFNGEIFKIILVGRLSEEKGQEFVIQRLAEIVTGTERKISIDFWGDGKDKDKLEKLVENLNLSEIVHFCGFSDHIDYSKYHLAIMSSRSEGFGRTTVEYMFNSIPVVGYDGGATPELIIDKVTGRLYKTSEEFKECIMDALSTYSDYQDYAEKAFKYACENFSLEKYMAKILDVFKRQWNN